MSVLGKYYNMEEERKGKLYYGIHLKWNYREGYVDIFMPNYTKKNWPNYCPYEPNPIMHGKHLDSIVHEIESPFLDKLKTNYLQQVLGSFLYYARIINMTILHALSAIAPEQAKPRERTLKQVQQLLHYMHTNSTREIGQGMPWSRFGFAASLIIWIEGLKNANSYLVIRSLWPKPWQKKRRIN